MNNISGVDFFIMVSKNTLLKLAGEYGTPLYVYDGDEIVRHYQALYDYIDYKNLQICYAMKANYNPAVIKALSAAGCGIDAVSPGEVFLALKLGVPAEKIIYTANNMTDEEVALVRETGVLMNIGSISRLRKFAAAYPESRICLRFNPDVCDGDNAKTMTGGDLTKFGILLQDVELVKSIVKSGNLHVVGLHEHTGSGLQHAESVYQSMKNLMAVATAENFPELEFLDFGGGFKVPYRPDEKVMDYRKMGGEIVALFTEYCQKYGKELKLVFEPGKYMVAESGFLITQVNTVKKNRTRVIIGCNSGFPQLIRPVLYDAYHQIFNLSNPNGAPAIYDICGNICETGDRFAEQREMPEIREGDFLAIANAGAYCYSMGGIYNLRAMPPEVVILNGEAKLVRPRVSSKDLADSILNESILQ